MRCICGNTTVNGKGVKDQFRRRVGFRPLACGDSDFSRNKATLLFSFSAGDFKITDSKSNFPEQNANRCY